MRGSLTIVGPLRVPHGMAQLMATREATAARNAIIARIEVAQKVYHLIEEPDVRERLIGVLAKIGVHTEDLSIFYETSGHDVNEVHLEVAEWILQAPRLGTDTVAMFSGRRELCDPPATAVSALALAADIAVTFLPHVFALPGAGRAGPTGDGGR